MTTVNTFCLQCAQDVLAELTQRTETIKVRGENIEYDATIAVCPHCETEIGDLNVEDANLKRAYDIYRKRHAMMSPREITDLRNAYNLSLREFSLFLGFGEQTVARYERGALPDVAHNNILLQAKTVLGAEQLLNQNRSRITQHTCEKVEEFIAGTRDNNDNNDNANSLILTCPAWMQTPTQSPETGFRNYELERTRALIQSLAIRCPDLYFTKLQKAMFFTDSLAYERLGNSLSGTVYVHAPYGPMADGREYLYAALRNCDELHFVEKGDGEILQAERSNESIFTPAELEVIEAVAAFVNSFPTSTALSNYSHNLEAWKCAANGKPITYGYKFGEIEEAIAARMNEL